MFVVPITLSMSGNASFGIANEHIAFARYHDILQAANRNKDIKVITQTKGYTTNTETNKEQNSSLNNVTTILLFVVLCVVVNLFMSFCRCLCTRWCLKLSRTKDEMLTQKCQGQLKDLPSSRRRETVSMIDNPIYAPSAPTADYRRFSNTPLQQGALNHYCVCPKIGVQDDSIPDIQCDGRRYVMYPAASYEILI